jgi:uncharacterized protein (DUF58 family)
VTPRFTGVATAGLTLVALAVFLAVVSGRPELFVLAGPLVAVLLSALRGPRAARYTLTQGVSPTRLLEGDRLTVTVTLTAQDPLPLVELLADRPPLTELVAGDHRVTARLGAGERRQWTYALRRPARGRFTVGSVHVRISDGTGVRVWEASHVGSSVVTVYPQLAPLRRVPQPLRTQTSVGNYVAAEVGAGLEPGEIRLFVPGDPVRRVNWRASLRLGKLYVTQHHLERNADVVLMLDTLSQVGRPPVASLDMCARAAASLASVYLARKDRVGLIEYGGTFRWVRPAAGRAQLERIMDALAAAQPAFTYVKKDLVLVPPRNPAPAGPRPRPESAPGRALGGRGDGPGGAPIRRRPAGGVPGRGDLGRPAALAGGGPGVPAVGGRASRAARGPAPARAGRGRVDAGGAARAGTRAARAPSPANGRGLMRLLPALALAVVVGLVLGTDASTPVAGLAGVSAILGVGGVLGRSFPLIRASAGLVVVAYALALLLVAPAPDVVTPALIGGASRSSS